MANSFGENLKTYRLSNRLTQQELADIISLREDFDISYKSISKWENGESIPSIDIIIAIAKLLDITIDTLLSSNIEKFNNEASPLDEQNVFKKLTSTEINLLYSAIQNLSVDKDREGGNIVYSGKVHIKTITNNETNTITAELLSQIKEFPLSDTLCTDIGQWSNIVLKGFNIYNLIYHPVTVYVDGESDIYVLEIYFNFNEKEIIDLYCERATRKASALIKMTKTDFAENYGEQL